jgi:hypothetical protein
MARLMMKLRIGAAALVLGAGSLSSAVPAQARVAAIPPDCPRGTNYTVKFGPVEAVSTVNDNVAGIYLLVSSNDACVQGRVEGPLGAEIWIDRCQGSSCTGFLGKNKIQFGSLADTGNWNDQGVRSRACGSSGANDHDIVCTPYH